LKREAFRGEVDGKPVDLYVIRNREGMAAGITNLGAKVMQVLAPDRHGRLGDVALGYDSLAGLQAGQASMGAFIGRYANRIAGARFSLDGNQYRLAANSGPNSLHGGTKGSRFVVFDARQLDRSAVQMRYTFRDGEEGFPGTLPLRVVYRVTERNELEIAYDAVAADKATVANFTTHVYWNLAGHDAGDILGHVLQVDADRFLPVDATLIPTGELRRVRGTPMDFTRPMALGKRIGENHEQLALGRGYDHHFVLNRKSGEVLAFAARIAEPESGRVMEVWSTEPGIQVVSGNNLEGSRPRDLGKGGALYGFRSGFCLEPSHFPDSVNRPGFPSTALAPGEWYSGKTVFRFSVEKAPLSPRIAGRSGRRSSRSRTSARRA
jgi:aldose 1-epimerase